MMMTTKKNPTPSTWWYTTLLALLLLAAPLPAATQQAPPPSPTLDASAREAIVTRISEMLADNYVYEDIGKEAGSDLVTRLQAGEFDEITDRSEFATHVTTALQNVTNDKHLRVRVRPPARAQLENEDPAAARAARLEQSRRRNFGFEKLERLQGNIGYVEMRSFDGHREAKAVATAAMNFLANSDAVIFDMRRNGGGSPDMIRHVSSWFFSERTHLNSMYFRQGDRTIEFWTLEDIPGTKRPDVPIFVLTSSRTFSGAEEFSYNLRNLERATLIGEVTGGGANPGGNRPINDQFEMFIPVGAAVSPITGTNWEGIGVMPHIEVSADEAYDIALEKARAAAEEYRARSGEGGGSR